MTNKKTRLNSISIVGGAFGDEGKGKIVDRVGSNLVKRFGSAIVYRWNGGANAGHTVEVGDKKIVLHQIPSGALTDGAHCVLGKGMVIHPGDLVEELKSISDSYSKASNISIDEMAVLSLNTHRAFESVLKLREDGGSGSTGRGISPAYADVVYRHPLRMRDLISRDWEDKFTNHYLLYKDLVSGMGKDISKIEVSSLAGGLVLTGTKSQFIKKLSIEREIISDYIKNVYDFINENWQSNVPFVFEGAQGVGLDLYWGVYPDITASNPTPSGIFTSTDGIVDPDTIEIRANVYKATYTSSVGKRILPAKMNEKLASKIREDAGEYGATTKRPRDIYHVDIPSLYFFAKVSNATHMVLTHMDICYKDTPVKICTEYINNKGQSVAYRPDQKYLDGITPRYIELKPWNGYAMKNIKDESLIPQQAKEYVSYLSSALNLKCLMVTTGPERDSVIENNYLLL